MSEMKRDDVQIIIEQWKAKTGLDVQVKMRYYDGSYYRRQQPKWFGETARFCTGPFASAVEVLDRLAELEKPNERTKPV